MLNLELNVCGYVGPDTPGDTGAEGKGLNRLLHLVEFNLY